MSKLTKYEQTILNELIEKLTGNYQQGVNQKQIFASNVEALMQEAGTCFSGYLNIINNNPAEFLKFISSVTIHTTSWFRELEHFTALERIVREKIARGQNSFKVWSAAASTGQEVYTIGLVLESLKLEFPDLKYKIYGTDIDGLAIEKASRAIYSSGEVNQIPKRYLRWILKGQKKVQNYFTIDPVIRENCSFKVENLDAEKLDAEIKDIDFIFCRNVLIYFHPSKVRGVTEKMLNRLKPEGLLILAHSEAFAEKFYGLKSLGRAIYQKISGESRSSSVRGLQKTVLIVDDDQDMRFLLKKILKEHNFETLEAANSDEASEAIAKHRVDLISLDLHMPGKDGITWLRDIRAQGYRIPVMIVSGTSPSEAALVYGAFEKGAQEFFEKELLPKNLKRFGQTAIALSGQKIDDEVVFVPPPELNTLLETFNPELIVIGASTGGPEAIWKLIQNILQPCPPILIVQHTSPFYSKYFAETLRQKSGLTVSGHIDGEKIKNNHIYVSHGDYHLEIESNSGDTVIKHAETDKINGHRPSVDNLFLSVAKTKLKTLTFLLTGMGDDGAKGMAEIFKRGDCFNIAQSKDSCVVYSMPKEAVKLKGVHWVADVDMMRKQLDKCISNANLKVKSA